MKEKYSKPEVTTMVDLISESILSTSSEVSYAPRKSTNSLYECGPGCYLWHTCRDRRRKKICYDRKDR
jgi:hypothetical protein